MQFLGNNRKMWPQNWCITSKRNGKVWWFKQTKIPALTSKYTNRTERQQTKTRHLLLPPTTTTTPKSSGKPGFIANTQGRKTRECDVTACALQCSRNINTYNPNEADQWSKPTLPMGCFKQKPNTGWCWFSLTTLSNDLAGLRGARVFYMVCSTITGL